MNRTHLHDLLLAVAEGQTTPAEALGELSEFPGIKMDFAHLDTHRQARTGIPEVVFGEGKSASQIARILERLAGAGQVAIATRVDDTKAEEIRRALPGVVDHRVPRVMVLAPDRPVPAPAVLGTIGVLCAGTSDLPVAEEAAVVLEALGHPVVRYRDVGVAGLHRLLGHVSDLRRCAVLIVVAGMEGALASVVAGLVGRPVIGVPTSIGYGASFQGVAALLAMLNACAPGVSVVNIDNGFGAACQAALINLLAPHSAPTSEGSP